MVEISWDNKFWEEEKIVFLSTRDSYNISYGEFKQVLSLFLNSIISEIENKFNIEEWKERLEILN